MIKLPDPQFGDQFVGRDSEIQKLKQEIFDNRIVVVVGNRGIGKTNLMHVVKTDLTREGQNCYFLNGLFFYEQIDRVFRPSRLFDFTGISFPIGGISWNLSKPFILEILEKSNKKIIFVENAQKLDEKALELIFEATQRNKKIKFVIEIAAPYFRDIKLKPGSYKSFRIGKLDYASTTKLVKNLRINFSDKVVERIVRISNGYPYIARALVYICAEKNTEDKMLEFLITLKGDEKYLVDQIHMEVLGTLGDDAQNFIKKVALAPSILTLNLIEAFSGKEIDTALSDIIERGILKCENENYQIYHPLFREYLRNIQLIAQKNKKIIYCKAMEKVKLEFDSFFMLFEVLEEIEIFKNLIEIADNYNAINSIGIQSFYWGKVDQAVLAWSQIQKIAIEKQNKRWESVALGNMGNIYCLNGELNKALENYQKSMKLYEKIGNKKGLTMAYESISNVYLIKGDLDQALEYHYMALNLCEELGNTEGKATVYVNLGIIYKTKGDINRALEYYENSMKFYEELDNKDGIATVYVNLGNIYVIKGKLDKALDFYKNALELDEMLGRIERMACAYGCIGNVYRIKGELEKALEYFENAKKIYNELGSKEGLADYFGNVGNIYGIKGEFDKALDFYEKSLKLETELEKKEGMATAYVNLGITYKAKGDLDKALEYYNSALILNKDLGKKEGVAIVYGNIGNVYIIKEEVDKALEY